MNQIGEVKKRYLKLDETLNKREKKAKERGMTINKEATQRIIERTTNENKRIVDKQQIEELEAKRKRFKVSSTDYIESSSDHSETDKQ